MRPKEAIMASPLAGLTGTLLVSSSILGCWIRGVSSEGDCGVPLPMMIRENGSPKELKPILETTQLDANLERR